MAGTKEGAAKAKLATLARNPNHYSEAGKKGGAMNKGKVTGFAAMDRDKLVEAARRGGQATAGKPRRRRHEND